MYKWMYKISNFRLHIVEINNTSLNRLNYGNRQIGETKTKAKNKMSSLYDVKCVGIK